MIDNMNLSKGFHPDPAGPQQIHTGRGIVRGEWVYGWPVQSRDYYAEKAWMFIEYPQVVEVIPESLCAYAGETTFGNVLYEGDIVRFQYAKYPYIGEGELEFDCGTFGVQIGKNFIPMRDFTDSRFEYNKYDVLEEDECQEN